ncbi:hypothetical protein OUZ56_027552 [Daphnia magna]|uniref:Uncharacterized protein n=1 Tax=Daphnia magna TaxID=35525 RepID=A0ABQ9ZQ32_9CRUS|nr:hypothetical protein OUZ56_027552 [Daphnia magna]
MIAKPNWRASSSSGRMFGAQARPSSETGGAGIENRADQRCGGTHAPPRRCRSRPRRARPARYWRRKRGNAATAYHRSALRRPPNRRGEGSTCEARNIPFWLPRVMQIFSAVTESPRWPRSTIDASRTPGSSHHAIGARQQFGGKKPPVGAPSSIFSPDPPGSDRRRVSWLGIAIVDPHAAHRQFDIALLDA